MKEKLLTEQELKVTEQNAKFGVGRPRMQAVDLLMLHIRLLEKKVLEQVVAHAVGHGRTSTGRLKSKPNLQNVPIGSASDAPDQTY